MKKLISLLLLALPVNIHAQDQKPISTATICFYRPHRFEGSALKPPLFVDDIDVAHLHNGDAVEIIVFAGPHRLNSNDKSTGIELDAKAGQTYYIRVDIKTGAWKGHGAMTLVDPQQGKYEFSKQKISVTKNLDSGATKPAKSFLSTLDWPKRWTECRLLKVSWRTAKSRIRASTSATCSA